MPKGLFTQSEILLLMILVIIFLTRLNFGRK